MNKTAKKFLLAAAAATLAAGIPGQAVRAESYNGVKAGVLTCNVASGWSFVFGSSRDLKCTYSPVQGTVEHYVGPIDRFGVDVGYTAGGVIAWAVVAPSNDLSHGALDGKYGGLTAGATAGVGVAANMLVGGSQDALKTISLQPVSIEGNTGLNVAAGVAELTLKTEGD